MIGVLLTNLGTPDAPTRTAVRRYLKEFLSDPYVMDIHPVARWLLLNFFILPFRSSRSASQYQKIWTGKGSPILIHTRRLGEEVQKGLGEGFIVEIGMRYGRPSLGEALEALKEKGVGEIRVLPLYPQKASSSTTSTHVAIEKIAKEKGIKIPVKIRVEFFNHPGFISSFVEIGKPMVKRVGPDHLLFSFHGLPERHVQRRDQAYPEQCRESARLIAKGLGVSESDYSVSFQSRLGRTPWIRPYTDFEIPRLIREGKKRLLFFAPSFVADCLETLEEIGIRMRALALREGADVAELVPSLNTHPGWVKAVCEMLRK